MRSKFTIFICSLIACFLMGFVIIQVRAAFDLAEVELAGFHNVNDFYASNRYTYSDEEKLATSEIELTMGDTVTQIETDFGVVYVDEETLAFQYENNNGYIWSSTVNYNDENNGLNNYYRNLVRSALIIRGYNLKSATYNTETESLTDRNTTVDFKIINNGFTANIFFNISKIKLQMTVLFEEDGISVAIPNDSIEETGNFLLYDIVVYPYFGAVLDDSIPGYIFVPDGVGALVRYKHYQNVQSNYEKAIYGKDLSYSDKTDLNTESTTDARIYAPVFGFVHGINQNAFLSIIESGQEFATINLEYSGKLTNYSTIYSRYIYRQVYLQPIDKAGNTISLLQTKMNDVNIAIKYLALEDEQANYVGMANCYKKYLEQNSSLSPKVVKDNIPLKLETIGLEKTTGVLFDKSIVMTTFEQYLAIINDLKANGISEIVGLYQGFTKNGVSWSAPNYEKYSKKLGNNKDLENLLSDNQIYFSVDYQKATSKSSGYNTYFDLAKKINDQRYTYTQAEYTSYLLKHQVTKELLTKSVSKLTKLGINDLAVQNMGSLLYADSEEAVDLKEAITIYHQALNNVRGNVALTDANSYMWQVMDEFFNFPMYSSQYLHFDDTVPFLAIVLSSSMNIYSTNANFYSYPREELLRMIDYNVYPSFVVTNKSSQKLEETALNYIYSSRYSDVKKAILQYYDFINTPLKQVNKATLLSRYIPEVGVAVNTYSNGVTIIINYTDSEITYHNIQVSPMNYSVMEGDN